MNGELLPLTQLQNVQAACLSFFFLSWQRVPISIKHRQDTQRGPTQ